MEFIPTHRFILDQNFLKSFKLASHQQNSKKASSVLMTPTHASSKSVPIPKEKGINCVLKPRKWLD